MDDLGGGTRLSGVERQQLQFVRFARPGAALATLIVYGIYALVAPAERVATLLSLLALALAVSLVAIVALRRWSVGLVARATIAVDIVLIAVLIAILDEPALLLVPFYAPLAFSALLFGPVETAVYTILAGAAGAVIGEVVIGADSLTVVVQLLVFGVTGAILSALSREARSAQVELARERVRDSTALDIAQRIRFSARLEDVLRPAVEELAQATGSSRCLLRLAPRSDGSAPLFEWDAPGVGPAGQDSPPLPIKRVLASGAPLVVNDSSRADSELRAFARSMEAAALIAYPIVWNEDVIAAIGFTDDEPRDWGADALPLIERVAPLLAAALAQAELVEHHETTLALREELIANVSHELRTPLTSTIGFLQTLDRTDIDLTRDERTELLAVARREAERLAVLVEDLLQLTRLERGDLPLEKSELDLAKLAKRAAEGVEVPAEREIVLQQAHLFTQADPGRILQVVQNLLTNSIRHGEGQVSVNFEWEPGAARLVVTDEGHGVPDDQVPQLFVPFARTSTRTDSSGLGLAISRRIAEAHGGSLSYRPAENGERHAFVLELPA
jgi:signal transduction histidine kinase